MAYQNLRNYLNKTMAPRAICNTAPSLSESTVLPRTARGSQTFHGHAPAAAIQPCLGGAHTAGKQGPEPPKKTQLSVQLAGYLNSPLAQDSYTGVAVSEGIGIVKRHKKDMEMYLYSWGKNWEKMAAAKDK